MNIRNIQGAAQSFEVLQGTKRSQTAVLRLEPGEASSEDLNSHAGSDQILLVIEGEVKVEISGEEDEMKAGDVVIVPAGAKHRFTNTGGTAVLTFSVYAPPSY